MHETDWNKLFVGPGEIERDAVVAWLFHKAEELREEVPQACFYLRRAAESIIQGKHLGA